MKETDTSITPVVLTVLNMPKELLRLKAEIAELRAAQEPMPIATVPLEIDTILEFCPRADFNRGGWCLLQPPKETE